MAIMINAINLMKGLWFIIKKMPNEIKKKLRKIYKIYSTLDETMDELEEMIKGYDANYENILLEYEGNYVRFLNGGFSNDMEDDIDIIEKLFLKNINKEDNF